MRLYCRKSFTLVEIMIVVVIIATVVAIALLNYTKLGSSSKVTICITNLKQIDGAVDQWAIDYGIPEGTVPSAAQEDVIYSYIKKGKPTCPSGGVYTINAVGSNPQVSCSKESEGHRL